MNDTFIQVHDTDVWEEKITKKTYNPIKVIMRFNKDDMIVLKDVKTNEEIQIKLDLFKKEYERIKESEEYNITFGI